MRNCYYCEAPMYRPGEETKIAYMARAGFKPGDRGASKFVRYARETKEHLKRIVDGGKGTPTVPACCYCNSTRAETPFRVHRNNMRYMVKAGLHPVASAIARTSNGQSIIRSET